MIFHYMRMVRLLRIHRVPFNWRVALSFVYDPPYITRPEDRHNEVRGVSLVGSTAQGFAGKQNESLPVGPSVWHLC